MRRFEAPQDAVLRPVPATLQDYARRRVRKQRELPAARRLRASWWDINRNGTFVTKCSSTDRAAQPYARPNSRFRYSYCFPLRPIDSRIAREMQRRRFLLTGATFLSAATTLSRLAFGDSASASTPLAPGLTRLGAAEAFDYAKLKGVARKLAAAPYKSPARPLPPHVAGLDWDKWQSIIFRKNRALWASEDLPFEARFFHLGFTMTKPVRMYAVENGKSQQIAYDPALFDYGKSGIKPGDAPPDLGFAGFNLFFHTDFNRDRAAFQGASYFRAVDNSRQYGMSQRGLAVNCGMMEPEEFPDFIAYYLEKPVKGSNQVTLYGLLDSPSVAGAYRFVIDVADTLVMDIDAALYPRKEIERIGIAPGTSMFFYGKTDRRPADDWRPRFTTPMDCSSGPDPANGSGGR